MPDYFSISTDAPLELTVEAGQKREVGLKITNNQMVSRTILLRVGVLDAVGGEVGSAPEYSWLEVAPRDAGSVPSGGEVTCKVVVDVPASVQPGHTMSFRLVAYDADQPDEIKNNSAPFEVTVSGDPIQPIPPPPPPPKRPKWWVFMPAAGVALVWLILAAVAGSDDDRALVILIPVILTLIGALALTISSSIMARKKAPIDQATYNYGWGATAVSGFFVLFAIGCSIAAAVASSKDASSDISAGEVVLVFILVLIVSVPLPLSILVIKRQSG